MNTLSSAQPGLSGILQGYRDALQRSWSRLSPESRIITVCLALMIVGGVILRAQSLAYPTWFTFDEEGFAKNAHNYGLRVPDDNDHPPLGKLLIAVGMMLFGYNSLGWRFVPLVFGIQTVVLTFWLARSVFGRTRAAWIATAFVAADGFFISYSRSALFDGMMLTFTLWAMVLAYEAINWRGVLASGVMIGLAMTCKWVAIVAVVPAALALLVRRRVSIFSVLAFAIIPVIHIAIWSGALALTGKEYSLPVTWKTMVDLYKHHLSLGKYHNDLSSPWWGWPIAMHPVVIKYSSSGIRGRYSTSLSNLLLFASVTILALTFPLASLAVAIKTKFKRYWLPFLDAATTKGALQMLLGWFIFIFPWVLTMSTRGNYTFHHYYLPPYAFGVIMLAGLVEYLERKRPNWAVLYVTLACAISIFYMPVWGEFNVTSTQANYRLFMKNWKP